MNCLREILEKYDWKFRKTMWSFRENTRKYEKSLAQEVRQKIDIWVRRNKGPLGHTATCKGSSYTKNEYNLFYQKLDTEYFFIQFFSKKAVFSEKTLKNCFGSTFDDFLGKGGDVLHQKLT